MTKLIFLLCFIGVLQVNATEIKKGTAIEL